MVDLFLDLQRGSASIYEPGTQSTPSKKPTLAIKDPSRVIFPLLRFRFTVNAFALTLCLALHEIISNAAFQPGEK